MRTARPHRSQPSQRQAFLCLCLLLYLGALTLRCRWACVGAGAWKALGFGEREAQTMGSPTKPGALSGTLDLLLCPKMAVQRVIVGGPAGVTQVSGGSSLPGQRAQCLAALILRAISLTAHRLTLLVPPQGGCTLHSSVGCWPRTGTCPRGSHAPSVGLLGT